MRSEHKLHIPWIQVDAAVGRLHQSMVEHKFKPARILAVARGGLIPAVMLSHLFGVQEIGSIQLSSYGTGTRQSDITALNFDPDTFQDYNRSDTLIVDDLWDSGKTHEWLRKTFPWAVTCTAFFKDRRDNSHKVVSFPGTSINPGYWAVFPWELEASASGLTRKN